MEMPIIVRGKEEDALDLMEKAMKDQFPELLKQVVAESEKDFLEWYEENAEKHGLNKRIKDSGISDAKIEFAKRTMAFGWAAREPAVLRGMIADALFDFAKDRHRVAYKKIAFLEGKTKGYEERIEALEEENRKLRHTIDNVLA